MRKPAVTPQPKPSNVLRRRASGLMALEQRFMFDGAALADAMTTVEAPTPEPTPDPVVAPVPLALPLPVADAEQQAQQKVLEFLQQASDQQMFALFNGGKESMDAAWAERLADLREAFSSGELPVQVKLMEQSSQFTALAAFTPEGPDGEPSIFVNPFWVGLIGAQDLAGVLVEELGHWMDAQLNPNGDTPGDEGQGLAAAVLGMETLATRNDSAPETGWVMLDGVSYAVEFASFNFVNAYEMVYDLDNDTSTGSIDTSDIDVSERWADKEQNLHYFNSSVSLGVVRISDGTNDQNFSGNDVSATTVVVGGQTHYGWISRPIKANGIVRGFYFWTDTRFTSLAAAQADGNQDGDRSVLNNRGFVFVVDQAWFDSQISSTRVQYSGASASTPLINNQKDGNLGSIWVAEVGSSSDRVDSALNSVLTPNSAPRAANDSNSGAEGSAITRTAATGLLSNDSDPNNDALTLTSFSVGGVSTTVDATNGGSYVIANVGTILIYKDGSYTFTPLTNYTGSVPPITYTVIDGNGSSATAVLSLSVTPVNDAPTANSNTQTINENTVASGTVTANDSDPDGDSLTVTGFTYSNGTSTVTGTLGSANTITLNGVTVGTLTLNANGTYSFTPASNYSGTVPVFTYAISDGQGGTASSTLTISLTNLNNAPVANPDNEDGTLFAQAPGCASGSAVSETQQTGNVLTNDTDADGSITAGTTHQVTSVSSATGNTWSGTAITGKYGVLTIGANGAYSYNVNENNAEVKALTSSQTLSESFNYTVSEIGNSPNLTASSTLRIVIKGVNNAPTAVNDYDTIIEAAGSGSPTTYGSITGNVITNDRDVDSASFSVTKIEGPSTTTFTTSGWPSNINSVKNSPSSVDTVQISSDGTNFTTLYSGSTKVLVSSFSGSGNAVSVVFTDGQPILDYVNAHPTSTITLRLKIGSDTYDGTYGSQSTTAGSSANVTSSASGSVSGQYGSLSIASNGAYTYTLTSNALNAGQTYQERFTYTVTDASGCASTATLYIVVNGTTTLVMDDESVSTAENTDLTVAVGDSDNLLTGDSGFSGTKTVTAFSWGGTQGTIGTALTREGVGTLTINANGSYTFSPATNYSGPVPDVLYTASDGSTSAQAVLKISITAVDNASALVNDTRSIAEDGRGSGNVLDNDTDADNTLSVASYTWNDGSSTVSGTLATATAITSGGVTVGTLTLESGGTYTFVPSANWNGTVPTITYTTNTGSTATLVITVTPVNDAPTLDLDGSGTGTGWSSSYTNQGTAAAIADTDVAIADLDDTHIENATIVLTNPQTGDTFNVGTLPTGITVSSGPTLSNGALTLTLTGSASLANYQSAIQAITFSSTGNSTVDRVVSVKVNDGDSDSNTAYTTIAVSADSRLVTVMGTVVNEASPYVMFEVTGVDGQWVSLVLETTGSGTGHASKGTDFLPNLEYFDGTSWVSYSGGLVQIPDTVSNTGKLLVRTAVLQDSAFESTAGSYETLRLTAKNAAGTANVTTDNTNAQADGTARIRDDGQGAFYLEANQTFTADTSGSGFPTYLDDDRPVSVNNLSVNEGSNWAVFTVTGNASQKVSFALTSGSATLEDGSGSVATDGSEDFGPALEVWNASANSGAGAWESYTAGDVFTLAGTTTYVRTAILPDSLYEGQHSFYLGVTRKAAGDTAYGTGNIYDDGSGVKYDGTFSVGAPSTITTNLDDDRVITVTGGRYNESSPRAIFTVEAAPDQSFTLDVVDEAAAGSAPTGDDEGGADDSLNTAPIYYSLDGGFTWQTYTAGSSITAGSMSVLVAVDIAAERDSVYEGPEQFKLVVTSGGQTASGYSTIVDDGTGTIYQPSSPNPDQDAVKDDDRPVRVNNIEVNENSPWAVFRVNGTAGQSVALELQNDSDAATANALLGTDTGTQLQYFNGTSWVNYTSAVTLPSGGELLVRVAVNDDNPYEGAETFQLKVTPNGGTAVYGTATILDDGTGSIYPDNTTGNPDQDAVKDDDRLVRVNNIEVNENSPWAVFRVNGTAGQSVALELQNDSDAATANALLGTDTGTQLQYFNGTNWVNYTSAVTLPSGGELLVRVAVNDDDPYEGAETFQLKVTPNGGTAVYGTATILDDGTGSIYPDSTTGNPDQDAVKDDDRPVRVNNIEVNENSPWAVFRVNGTAGQSVALELQNDSDAATANALLGTDTGTQLQYFNGTSWVNYTGAVTLPSGGELLVRVAVNDDNPYEGPETFQLRVTRSGGNPVYGTATILDDGTGSIYPDNTTGNPDQNAVKDDDRPVRVNDIQVNEASPYAVFTVSGTGDQGVVLSLQNDNDLATADAVLGTDTQHPLTSGKPLQVYNGSAWVDYTPGSTVTLINGQLLVRTAVVNDSGYEGAETFQLAATPTGGNAAYGTATILDDGTGSIYPDNTTGNPDLSATRNDDRPVRVNSIRVNEASPYAVFTVSGTGTQGVVLALQNDNAVNTADARLDTDTTHPLTSGRPLQVYDGSNWVNYTPGSTVNLIAGQLLVRTGVVNDTVYEGAETFVLSATPSSGNAAYGTATILDDGTGDIYPNNTTGSTDANAVKNDDRSITVSGLDDVSEGSNAVFTVKLPDGNPRDTEISLLISNVSTQAADHGPGFTVYYFDGNGTKVTLNVNNGKIVLPAGVTSFFVSVPTINDAELENAENLRLTATITGGNAADDTSTIVDDGTGRVYDNKGLNPTGPGDDDRPKAVAPPPAPPAPPAPALPPLDTPPPPQAVVSAQSFSSLLTPLAAQPTTAEVPLSLPEAVTSGSGYQIPVSDSAPAGLSVFRGVTDQFVQTTDTATKFSLPFDAFIHSNKDAVITLNAKRADDAPLPPWVQFDPATGVFEATPPAGFKGKLDIKVIARDDDGREVTVIFQMFVGEQQGTDRPQSRDSFSDKLRMAGKRPLMLVRAGDAAPAREAVQGRETALVRMRAG